MSACVLVYIEQNSDVDSKLLIYGKHIKYNKMRMYSNKRRSRIWNANIEAWRCRTMCLYSVFFLCWFYILNYFTSFNCSHGKTSYSSFCFTTMRWTDCFVVVEREQESERETWLWRACLMMFITSTTTTKTCLTKCRQMEKNECIIRREKITQNWKFLNSFTWI